ncbi:hypothetical protein PDJAM_G00065210 [Pangasius djambal]|uniref:Uncharacterized protein n=1 Tax=Pangasius djambal TaxID=1691987 RepID=A0ACC5YYW0_9TELE|nr:hypothetical protein [Pangasius djambal]
MKCFSRYLPYLFRPPSSILSSSCHTEGQLQYPPRSQLPRHTVAYKHGCPGLHFPKHTNSITFTALATAATLHPLTLAASLLIPWPDKYSGETSPCKGFLLQRSLYFAGKEGLLERQGTNLGHGSVVSRRRTADFYDWFIELFQCVFYDSPEGKDCSPCPKAPEEWLTMHSYARSVWNESSLKAAFHQGLSPHRDGLERQADSVLLD